MPAVSRHAAVPGLVLFAVLAFGNAERVGAQAPASLVAAHSPLAAVRSAVAGYYSTRYSPYTCSTHLPRHRVTAYAQCPFTARLRAVLLHPPYRVAGGMPLSRQPSPPRTVRLHVQSRKGQTELVAAWWDFGAQSFTTTFVVVRRGANWLINDEYCAGRPGTSLYRTRAPCA